MGRTVNDLSGEEFDNWLVLDYYIRTGKRTFWRCKCKCGNEQMVNMDRLVGGHNVVCTQCSNAKENRSPNFKDLTGRVFGEWSVIELVVVGDNEVKWLCRCSCGKDGLVKGTALTNGRSKSCGCKRNEGNRERNRLSPGQASAHSVYLGYTSRASREGIEFKLDEPYLLKLTSQDCYYCGNKPNQVRKSRCNTGDYIYNGIDRLNPELGYIEGNVVASCFTCNKAKLARSKDEFRDWIDRVYEHIHLKESGNVISNSI
jgi:hypothetical protein